jgi:hypothetical protein
LAEPPREIDQELKAGTYHATRDELAKIDEALAAVRRGEIASDEDVEAVFAKHRSSGLLCSGRAIRSPSDIAAPGEQTRDGDVLVDLLPMETDAAQFDTFALGGCRTQQPWKPCQRHTERAAIRQLDPHRVFIKAHGRRRNTHSKPSKFGRDFR